MADHRAFIGLGSNLPLHGIGSPLDILQQALRRLAAMPATELVSWSSTYESEPLPGSGSAQARYANAVCEVSTTLSPHALLNQLQIIEQAFQRVRSGHRWASRTLDLDLLLFNDQQIETPDLTVPHYAMLERNFVLVPLLEIAPNLRFVDGNPISEQAAANDRTGLALIKRFTSNDLALV